MLQENSLMSLSGNNMATHYSVIPECTYQPTLSHISYVHARKLRSADAAFELLESFKSIKSRGAIRKQMMNKMNDILQQFRREIDTTTAIFHTLKV